VIERGEVGRAEARDACRSYHSYGEPCTQLVAGRWIRQLPSGVRTANVISMASLQAVAGTARDELAVVQAFPRSASTRGGFHVMRAPPPQASDVAGGCDGA